MNDLVEVGTGDIFHTYNLDNLYGNITVVGSGVDSIRSFANGDIFSGITNAVGAVTDVASFLIDPIAELGSSIAGFLLDYMPPLPMMLDGLAGNPQVVEGIGATWENVGVSLGQAAEDARSALAAVIAGWQGAAADAFEEAVEAYAELVERMSQAASGIGSGFKVASIVVEIVRSIVKDLISDLVGKLISFASQAILSFGIGISWIVPQAAIKIAEWTERVRGWVTALTDKMTLAMNIIERLDSALGSASPGIERMVYFLRNAEIIEIGISIPSMIGAAGSGYGRGQSAFGTS